MKIPFNIKGTDVIAIGHLAIYCPGLQTAAKVYDALFKKEKKHGIPCMGKITVGGKSYWWCRYGFLNDPDIYTKPKRHEQKNRSIK